MEEEEGGREKREREREGEGEDGGSLVVSSSYQNSNQLLMPMFQ